MPKFSAHEVVCAVRRVVGQGRIDHLHVPLERDGPPIRIKGVHDPYPIQCFEESVARSVGVRNVVAVSSGTAALHLALRALGIGPGMEVIVPTMTFVAAANAVIYCGAIPHFVDGAMGIHPFKLRQHLGSMKKTERSRIRAMIAVDHLGQPGNLHEMQSISTQFEIPLIEDAAQSLGSYEHNRACGSFGKIAITSFNLNKVVTTMGGGAVMTEDDDIAEMVRHLSSQAKVNFEHHYVHDDVGYNYRMPAPCAAYGLPHMWALPETLDRKRTLATAYAEQMLEVSDHVIFVDKVEGHLPNWWLNAILIGTRHAFEYEVNRNALLDALTRNRIACRAAFTPLHTLPMYRLCPRQRDMQYAEIFAQRCVLLPSSPGLVEI